MLPVEEDGLGERTGGTGVSQIVTASLSESGADWGFPGSHGTPTLQAKNSPKTLLAIASALPYPRTQGHSLGWS